MYGVCAYDNWFIQRHVLIMYDISADSLYYVTTTNMSYTVRILMLTQFWHLAKKEMYVHTRFECDIYIYISSD